MEYSKLCGSIKMRGVGVKPLVDVDAFVVKTTFKLRNFVTFDVKQHINFFHFGRLPFWLSSILVVFHFGRLPFWSSSILVVFHLCRLPFWLSSILVAFHFGRLPFWSSSIFIVFHFGRLPF